jgi:hypothetical protein
MHLLQDRDTRLNVEITLTESRGQLGPELKVYVRKLYNQHAIGRFQAFWKLNQGGEDYNYQVVDFFENCGIQVVYTGTKEHNENAHVGGKIALLRGAALVYLAHSNIPFP